MCNRTEKFLIFPLFDFECHFYKGHFVRFGKRKKHFHLFSLQDPLYTKEIENVKNELQGEAMWKFTINTENSCCRFLDAGYQLSSRKVLTNAYR